MKNLILSIILLLSITGNARDLSFELSSNVHNSNKLNFKSHHGGGRFGSYLAMNIPLNPMTELLKDLISYRDIPLRSRGEAHITVITPLEYFDVLKQKVTIDEIDQIALRSNVQSSEFDVVCLGRGTAFVNNKLEETFYVVVESVDILEIRKEIFKLFIGRGGNPDDFRPRHYYPHITLGFTKRDLHETDGVIKGADSCYADLY